jgi:hypothetical protein
LNLPALVLGNPARGPNPDGSGLAVLGEAIELNLGGRGIRSIEANSAGVLIVAGPADNGQDFRLFTWTGNHSDSPQERLADLAGMTPEGIVEIPAGPLNDDTVVQLVSDNGTANWYADGISAKNLPEPFTKFRSDRVPLGSVVPRLVGSSYYDGASFSFSILGRSGCQYIIESSDNGFANWIQRGTIQVPSGGTGGAGTAKWSDSNYGTPLQSRFYRALDATTK